MILLRHAQSLFNVTFSVTRVDPGIEDPELTELGREQARKAIDGLRAHPIRRIITSPYTRALETTAIVNEFLNVPVTVDSLVGERAGYVCDVGTAREHLAPRWPQFVLDHLPSRWWPEKETEADIIVRCGRFRERMRDETDWAHVLVVTHWGFIRGLTGLTVANGEMTRFDPSGEPHPDPFGGM